MKKFRVLRMILLMLMLLCCGIAYHFLQKSDLSALLWLLYPAKTLVALITSISFSFHHELGYINEHYKIAIGKSCSGIQFFTTITAFGFCFITFLSARVSDFIKYICLLIPVCYLFTTVANTCRIVCGIYIQMISKYVSILAKPIVHESIGILIYGSAIILFYFFISKFLKTPYRYEKTI